MGNDQRPGIVNVATKRRLQLSERLLSNQAVRDRPLTQVLREIQENVTATVPGWINVNERVDVHVLERGVAKQARQAATDKRIDPVLLGISHEQIDQRRPRVGRRIADMCRPVRLVKRDPSSWSDESDRLRDDLLRVGNVDQHETRCDEIEASARELGRSSVPAQHLDVRQTSLPNHLASEFALILTSLDADDASRRPDLLGEQVEAAAWSAADLDDSGTGGNADLIEEPPTFACQL